MEQYIPLFAVYTPDRREVVELVTAEQFLELPRTAYVEVCGEVEEI